MIIKHIKIAPIKLTVRVPESGRSNNDWQPYTKLKTVDFYFICKKIKTMLIKHNKLASINIIVTSG